MSYVPHAALGAVKLMNGTVSAARLVINEAGKGVKYQMLCNVQVFGIPGSRTLKSVRYFGPLSYTVRRRNPHQSAGLLRRADQLGPQAGRAPQ